MSDLGTKKPAITLWRTLHATVGVGLLTQVALFGSGVALARALGPEGRGDLAFAQAFATSVGVYVGLGVPEALVYYLASSSRTLRLAALGRVVATQVVIAAVLVGSGLLVFGPINDPNIIILTALSAGGLIVFRAGLGIAQGYESWGLFNTSRLAQPFLYTMAVVGAFVISRVTVEFALGAWLLSNVLPAGCLFIGATKFVKATSSEDSGSVKEVMSYGVRALPSTASPFDHLKLDQLIVGAVGGNTILGAYAVAGSIGSVFRLIGQSIGIVAFPREAARHSGAEREDHFPFSVLMVLSLTAAGILIIVIPWLLPFLFGEEFAFGVTAAQIMVGVYYLAGVRRVMNDILRGRGRPGLSSAIEVLFVPVTGGLVGIGGMLWGLNGFAIGLLIGGGLSTGVGVVALWATRPEGEEALWN